MLDYLLHEEMVQFPKSIRAPGGQAVVKYLIGKDGHVTDVEFVEGTPAMQEAIEESLKKYVFRPFVVRGELVEVEAKQQFSYETR